MVGIAPRHRLESPCDPCEQKDYAFFVDAIAARENIFLLRGWIPEAPSGVLLQWDSGGV